MAPKSRVVVCLPKLSLIGLLLVRSRLGNAVDVRFDTYPLYGKVCLRWFRLPESWFIRIVSALAGVDVRTAAKSNVFRGSPRLNLEAMKIIVPMLSSLRGKIEETGWMRVLSNLLGPIPALAYYYRRFPWQEIWPQMIAAAICKSDLGDEDLILAWNPEWPEAWQDIVGVHLSSFGVTLFTWPNWYRSILAVSTNMFWAARVIISAVAAVLSHGWRAGKTSREQVSVVIEFIENSKLQGGPADSNYLEDGVRLKREDILYFVTREHKKILERNNLNPEAMFRDARASGFKVVELAKLRYSTSTLSLAAIALKVLIKNLPRLGAPCLAYTFWRAWNDFLTQVVLFDSYQPRNFLHTQNPNGCAGGRFESAIVTSLCRRFGSRSVGYQNRCIYDSVYEDSFDCYDVYLAWGDRWREVLGVGNQFIDEIAYVGCLHNEGFVPSEPSDFDSNGRPLVVSIFPCDLGGNLYPKTSTTNLLETCIALAKKNPNCRFRVKAKEPDTVDILLADDGFRELCDEVQSNFTFLKLARHDCAGTIAESDIVIAAAWTTPGSDALISGKRVIFYDEFQAGGSAFAGLPNIVAQSPSELVQLFEMALDDYQDYAMKYEDLLYHLDPFRDGNVRNRMLNILLDESEAAPGYAANQRELGQAQRSIVPCS